MKDINLEPGQALIFRNNKPTGDNPPLWRGKARLMSGACVELALWSNVAKDSGEVYLGGIATQISNVSVHQAVPTGTAGLWVNDKEGVEARPDHRGNITIGDEKHYLSIWEKTDDHDRVFLSGLAQDQATIDALAASDDVSDDNDQAALA